MGLKTSSRLPELRLTLGEELLRVHRNYQPLIASLPAGLVHAAAHITGGGLMDNLPRVLPNGLSGQYPAGFLASSADLSDHPAGRRGKSGGNVSSFQHGHRHGADRAEEARRRRSRAKLVGVSSEKSSRVAKTVSHWFSARARARRARSAPVRATKGVLYCYHRFHAMKRRVESLETQSRRSESELASVWLARWLWLPATAFVARRGNEFPTTFRRRSSRRE